MMDMASAKLITIIASSELEDRLEKDLRRLGARGYTAAKVEGRGGHGPRNRGMFDIGNVRLETVVTPDVAEKVLGHLEQLSETFDLFAFIQDVQAMPRKHFA
jgi:nitrogen regulatory protein PII